MLKSLMTAMLFAIVALSDVEARKGGGSSYHAPSHSSYGGHFGGYGGRSTHIIYSYSSYYHHECRMDAYTRDCVNTRTNISGLIFWSIFACCCVCGGHHGRKYKNGDYDNQQQDTVIIDNNNNQASGYAGVQTINNGPVAGYGGAPIPPAVGYGGAPVAPAAGYGGAPVQPAAGYGGAPVAPAAGYGGAPPRTQGYGGD